MKVYFASDFGRAPEVVDLARRCSAVPQIEVVSRWHASIVPEEASSATLMGGPPDAAVALAAAARNLEDLDTADVLVVLTTGALARGGRHFETGYAYHAGTPIVLAGPVEHAFHRLPNIKVVADPGEVQAVLECLAGQYPGG
jgi:hypothetical protein